MLQRSHPPQIEGLTWLGQENTEDILFAYRAEGAESLRVILDYDGTLTGEYVTWDAGRDALPPPFRNRHLELYDENKSFEDADALTFERRLVWSAEALQLHVLAQTPRQALERAAHNVRLHDYGKMILRVSQRANVGIGIFSSGIVNIIEMNLDTMNKDEKEAGRPTISPAVKKGARLLFKNEVVVGWDFESLYTTNKKRESDHPELIALREARPNALVVGNQLPDSEMVNGHAVRLIIINDPVGTPQWREKAQRSKERGFDGAISSPQQALELEQWILGKQGLLLPVRR